jgi:heptosyltransferase-2
MKLLIVGPAWVGDMVVAHALVRTLLAAQRDAEIHVLAPPASAPLGRRMPGVTDVVTLPVRHGELDWRVRLDVGHALRRVGYDRAIVLPNSFKSALVPFFAGIPRRTGWRGEWRYGVLNDVRALDTERLPRLLDRFVALADAANSPTRDVEPKLTADPVRAAALATELGLATDRPILALCPGAEYGPRNAGRRRITQPWRRSTCIAMDRSGCSGHKATRPCAPPFAPLCRRRRSDAYSIWPAERSCSTRWICSALRGRSSPTTPD